IPQERLYDLFRPYGRIHDIVPNGAKSASIIFASLRSATSARNCLHSATVFPLPPASSSPTSRSEPSSPPSSSLGDSKPTVVRILYKPTRHLPHVRDWLTSHPKIVLPLLVALLGTISYVVFDPVRERFVQAKVEGTFDPDRWRAVKWLKKQSQVGLNSIGSMIVGSSNGGAGRQEDRDGQGGASGIEKEREEAKDELKAWLRGNPESFVTVQGPTGSGKTMLVDDVLRDAKNILVIDCKKICKAARTDAKLVSELATAVGYYPQFVLASSLNNMIDLASVGLIGQKAGFSSNLDTQLKAILEVTTSALSKISTSIRARSVASSRSETKRQVALRNEVAHQFDRERAVRDGRIDAVAGNGAMSELGAGIEEGVLPDALAIEGKVESPEAEGGEGKAEQARTGHLEIVGPQSRRLVREAAKSVREGTMTEAGQRPKDQEMERLPVVVIKGYAAKGETKQEVLWDVLGEWGAVLVENQIAHVIFTSDSPTLSKPLAKALPSKPFNAITLTDASPEASLQYVEAKLSSLSQSLLPSYHASVSRLGGRQTDLDLLIQKVRAGQEVDEAVQDIVSRSASEIRKNFFGDDEEEAKGLKWKREQAGAVVRGLSDKGELKYAETLLKTFGGDEAALRALETAEMISITHKEGRPSSIRPGRPVYRSAFALLLSDPIFCSTLDYRAVTSALASAQNDLKSSQADLIELSKLFVPETGRWTLGGGSRTPREIEVRVKKTLEKMRGAEDKIDKLTAEKGRLLKVLSEAE
ncbi:hypothetical protein JCM10212_006519, partial [Sporobolomyces blumeae]